MSYTGRHRYKSRREKYQRSSRHLKAFFIFFVLAAFVYIFMNRHDIISYLKTYWM